MNDALEAVQIAALLMVAIGAWAVVAARDPTRQAVVASLYGLTLGILFFSFQAPDVALSNIVIGGGRDADDHPAGDCQDPAVSRHEPATPAQTRARSPSPLDGGSS